MTYTSKKFHGQVYIPVANWLLMIGTIIVTAVYKNTTSLGNAYGVCVILVTFITTFMIALVALIVWRIHWLLVFAVWLPIVTLDGLFLTAAMTKVPNGAWSTLMLAVILSSIFVLWRYGKEKQWSAEGRDRSDLTTIVLKAKDGEWKLAPEMGGRQLTHIKGACFPTLTPMVYSQP
jgi:KUP system potassium uptake protein